MNAASLPHSVTDLLALGSHLLWKMARGDTVLRFNYPLDNQSVVFDCGGYQGEWSRQIIDRYDPRVYIFEPVKTFAQQLKKKFQANPKVRVFDFGLAESNRSAKISLLDDASSAYRPGARAATIQLKAVIDFLEQQQLNHIDLLKINIEGGEYDLLPALLESDWINNITDIQVQFHRFIPNAASRRAAILQRLAKTHQRTYYYPYIWENWRKR